MLLPEFSLLCIRATSRANFVVLGLVAVLLGGHASASVVPDQCPAKADVCPRPVSPNGSQSSAKAVVEDDVVDMMQVHLQLKQRRFHPAPAPAPQQPSLLASRSAARSRVLRATYGAGSNAQTSRPQFMQAMSTLVQMHEHSRIHFLELVKRALEVQKDMVNNFNATDHARTMRIEQHRLALLLHAAALQGKAKKGESLPALDCGKSFDEGLAAMSRELSGGTVSVMQFDGNPDSRVGRPAALTSWGDQAPDDPQHKAPFEYLMDQNFIYDADNYLENWMAKKWGPLPPLNTVPKEPMALSSQPDAEADSPSGSHGPK